VNDTASDEPPINQTSEAAAQPSVSSLASRARSSVAWAFAWMVCSQGLRFGGNIALAHLLDPEAFGLFALVGAFFTGLHLFTDVGLRPSIVHSKRGDEPLFLNTAFSVQVVRSLILSAVAAFGGIPFALVYHQPRLVALIAAVAATTLIEGFISIRILLCSRHMRQKALTLFELVAQVAALATSISLAYLYHSVWAFVVSGMVAGLVRVVLSHLTLEGPRDRFAWDKPAVHELARFGRWVLISTALTFCLTQADRLVFGKLIPLSALGVYGVAAGFAQLPMLVIGGLVTSVLFPLFSRAHSQGLPLQPYYVSGRRPLLITIAWMTSGLAAGGEQIFHTVYSGQFAQGGWMLQILVFGGWLAALHESTTAAALALGRSRSMATANLAKLICTIAFIFIGFRLAAFPGALVGLSISGAGGYAVVAYVGAQLGVSDIKHDFLLSGWVIASAGSVWVVVHFLGRYSLPPWMLCVMVFIMITLLWSPLLIKPALNFLRRRSASAVAVQPSVG
jgi:O-antigen/teichoic acid export membrane protein